MAAEFIASLATRQQGRERKELVEEMRALFSKRLWHQLTEKLETCVKDPVFVPILPEMYEKFIQDFALKLNPLRLAQICVEISKHVSDPNNAITFLDTVQKKIQETKGRRDERNFVQTQQPLLFLKMKQAELHLLAGDVAKCRHMVTDGKEELESTADPHPAVSASVFWAAAQHAKMTLDYTEFFRSAIQFLAFVSSDDLAMDFKVSLAVDVGLAALLGDSIYGFGDLLLHPIVSALNDSYTWLREMLECFDAGNLHLYDELCQKHAGALNAQPALVQNERKLREKITILSLMDLVFRTPPDQRSIALTDIAARTKLNEAGVEELLMRCLSLHLLEGSIDQVDGVVHVSWVQPRVLTMPQITQLRDRLSAWVDKVKAASLQLEQEAIGVTEA